MKKTITILALIIGLLSYSQEIKKHNLSIISAPGTYIDFGHENYSDDGFNIGVLKTFHWNNWVYVGLEAVFFPKLNDLDYFHFVGKFGLNHYIYLGNIKPIIKLNLGFKGGIILRETVSGVPKILGLETGITFYIPNTDFLLLVNLSRSSKMDNKQLNGDSSHEVDTLDFGIGYRF